ncbi:transcription initiation factor iib [Plasmodium yoelii yoelii]|uniref:General transcription factor TFIIB n=2 Tax=Plasmodium yoelii yoelii TaxID=73239 RepID=Q7RAJ9_PLAYO|nr:transcription initiation factor iib [Plasmodium yoelii yoelii]
MFVKWECAWFASKIKCTYFSTISTISTISTVSTVSNIFRGIQNNFCPDCKEKGIIICDTSEGTQICNGCGLVIETNILSEEQEWRNFSNDGQSKSNDRNRVGEASDIWLENNLTSTTFIKSSKKLQHLNMMTHINKNDQTLLSAFNILKLICETFFLRSNVIERAKEITKELQVSHLKKKIKK